MTEYIGNEMETFESFYMKDKSIKNIIAIGDEIAAMIKLVPELSIDTSIDQEQMNAIYAKVQTMQPQQMSSKYGIPLEVANLLLPAAVVYKLFLERSKAELIWTPRRRCR